MSDILADVGSETEAPSVLLRRLGKKRSITGNDVAALRSAGVSLGVGSRQDAELMFAIERGSARKCRAWSDLLVETLLDHVVWSERPTGVLTPEAAAWLIGQTGPEPTPACLALLVAIVEEASSLPVGFHTAVRDRAMQAFAPAATLAAA